MLWNYLPLRTNEQTDKFNSRVALRLKNITEAIAAVGCWTALKIVWHRRKLNVRYIHINIWWHLNCNVICSKNFITPNILILFEYSIGWSTFNGIHILFVLYISNVGYSTQSFNYSGTMKTFSITSILQNLTWVGLAVNLDSQSTLVINWLR